MGTPLRGRILPDTAVTRHAAEFVPLADTSFEKSHEIAIRYAGRRPGQRAVMPEIRMPAASFDDLRFAAI